LKVEKDAVKIDEKKLEEEKRFDGKFVLLTSTQLSCQEVAKSYKSLWEVESAFSPAKGGIGNPSYLPSQGVPRQRSRVLQL
jgi:hypothetical protein